ncbi:hypothetical protein AB1Y20_016288 [Prymnesium parvum]|uniref:ADP,ATP carrier protein n=1 Tax=Prymnesium parvum TaxID=97485 RepID=A0AB34IEW9_PRYPA
MVEIHRSRRELAANTVASGGSITAGALLLNWLDCFRVRWQVRPPRAEETILSHFGAIVRSEGLFQGLWLQGLAANVCASASSYALRVGAYPLLRDALVLATDGEAGEKGGHHMFVAGFASGLVGFLLSTPLWQIKTRMHAEAGVRCEATGKMLSGAAAGRAPHFLSVRHGLHRLAVEGGAFHGATPLVIRGALLSGGQQLGYDGTKTICKRQALLEDGPLLHLAASIAAAGVACTFAAPFDFLQTRYQSGRADGTQWGSLLECARAMVAEGGGLIFFRGWIPFFGRLAPLFIINLPLYERLRRLLGLGYLE